LVADEIPDCGPISGILSCLKKSETDWNFIISVDTPFVTSDFITFLVAQAENFDAVIPDNAGYKEPLVALYNKKCLPIIEEQIARQQYKIHYLISLLNSRYINVNKWEGYLPKLFKNLNRPEDIQMQNKIL
jgi:molybdopterin-guanine dinucleotide biosynthesis protein A